MHKLNQTETTDAKYRILEALAKNPGVGVVEWSEKADASTKTIYKHLKRWLETGAVRKDGRDYSITKPGEREMEDLKAASRHFERLGKFYQGKLYTDYFSITSGAVTMGIEVKSTVPIQFEQHSMIDQALQKEGIDMNYRQVDRLVGHYFGSGAQFGISIVTSGTSAGTGFYQAGVSESESKGPWNL
ncbi:MAG: hypothetical protein ACLQEQ_05680 [Nitrososphaerales archaeon]